MEAEQIPSNSEPLIPSEEENSENKSISGEEKEKPDNLIQAESEKTFGPAGDVREKESVLEAASGGAEKAAEKVAEKPSWEFTFDIKSIRDALRGGFKKSAEPNEPKKEEGANPESLKEV